MAYRIKRTDSSTQKTIRRIACEELSEAVADIDDPKLSTARTVHEVRKQCKKMRGLIRLVRPAFSDFEDENKAFRDAAKTLSLLRDAHVFVETYDGLVRYFPDRIKERDVTRIRKFLIAQHGKRDNRKGAEKALKSFRKTLAGALERARKWKIGGSGFDSISGGLGATYFQARTGMECAADAPDANTFHEWRKDVKYHAYHARLLQGIWPEVLKPHGDAAEMLSDVIGRHHDLAVLEGLLRDRAPEIGNRPNLPAFLDLIEARQKTLEKKAFALGRRLFAEETDALVARWDAYWTAWQAA